MPVKRLLCASLLLVTVLAGGCSHGRTASVYGARCPNDLDSQLQFLDMKGVFREMAGELCLSSGGTGYGTVLVTDFVDLESLNSNASGMLMGELMRSSLSSVCGYNIQQAELAKYFTLGPRGLGVLTRRGESVRKDELGSSDFVVGTYSQSAEKLVLFAKKFNVNSNVITQISSKEIAFSCSEWGPEYTIY